MVRACTLLTLLVLLGSAPSGQAQTYDCYPDLPRPVVELTSIEVDDSGAETWIRYNLSVVNWMDYPMELFERSPDLPPCGLNTEASRTWLTIRDENWQSLNSYCSIYDPVSMGQIRFSILQGETAPEQIYVILTDRRCDWPYISAPIYAVLCHPDLPDPQLSVTGTEDYVVDGVEYTRYRLSVTNYHEYPEDLWTPSPQLPPCGLSVNSSRAWVDVYAGNGARLGGFCGVPESAGLQDLWFAIERGTPPPEEVYIVITDRACDIDYVSNRARTGCRPDLPAPVLELTGTQDYTVDGVIYTRYWMQVVNWDSYPPEFFEPRPDLPPCGANDQAARAWVLVYDDENVLVREFCGLGAPTELQAIYHSVRGGSTPPDLYIEIWDRDCDLRYRSNMVFGAVPTDQKSWGALKSAFE